MPHPLYLPPLSPPNDFSGKVERRYSRLPLRAQRVGLRRARLHDEHAEYLQGTHRPPSAFRRATAELGELFTAEDEKALDRAMLPPQRQASAPSEHGSINVATGEYTSPSGADLSPEAISRMQPDQITMIDATKLNAAQRQALINRMMQLGM
jgi:hypothetical protein